MAPDSDKSSSPYSSVIGSDPDIEVNANNAATVSTAATTSPINRLAPRDLRPSTTPFTRGPTIATTSFRPVRSVHVP